MTRGCKVVLSIVWLLSVTLSSTALARATSAFVYRELGRIPPALVAPSKFSAALPDACESLTNTADLTRHDCATALDPESTLPPAAVTADRLRQYFGDVQAAPSDAAAACDPTGPQSAAIVGYLAELQKTCHILLSATQVGQVLQPPQLQVLRTARDFPQVLELVEKWSDSGFAGPSLRQHLEDVTQHYQSPSGGVVPSLGTLSDQVVRGMTEFLQKRAQQEALRFLQKRLQRDLCGNAQQPKPTPVADSTPTPSDGPTPAPKPAASNQELLKLEIFKNTCEALSGLDRGTSMQAVGSYLRAAAEKDLRRLPDVSLAYVQHEQPALEAWALSGRLGIRFFSAVRAGRAPFEVLVGLGELPLQCQRAACKSIVESVRLVSAVAYALRQSGQDWHSTLFTNLTAQRSIVLAVSVALLAEKRLENTAASLGAASPTAAAFASLDVRGKANGAAPVLDMGQLAQRVQTLIAQAKSMMEHWDRLQSDLEAGSLSADDRRELLAGALRQSSASIGTLVEAATKDDGPRRSLQWLPRFAEVASSMTERRYGDGVIALLSELRESQVELALPTPVRRYLPLVVELGTANSSAEVAATMDAFAAPLGTYELKFHKPVLALNGFFGGLWGREDVVSDELDGNSGMLAAFAPVGLHATFPVIEGGLHLGGFVSILDVGALTTIRTGSREDKQVEGSLTGNMDGELTMSDSAEIGLRQVFSPGAYVTLGLFEIPLVLGVGVSYAPELRQVSQTQDSGEPSQTTLESDVSVLRYGLFVAVDIPVLLLN